MKTARVFLLTLIALAAIAGCKKESSDEPVESDPTPSAPVFQQLFEDNIAAATQNFTVNASAGGQVIAAQGTKLNFEPNAFTHWDGSPVTGPVEVMVVEALSIGDMIWLNKQTVGNDNGTLKLLRSGGALNLYASQGGDLLKITPSGLIVQIPTTIGDPAMQLFSGTEDTDGNMIWDPIDPDSASVTVDSSYTAPVFVFPYPFFYTPNPDSLNWINCDYFYSNPNITPFEVTIPAGQSTDSTLVLLAFPSINCLAGMFNSTSTGQAYSSYGVPIGMQVVVIGLQQTAGGYASSFTTVTVTAGISVPITFSPTTLAQFQLDVDAL